MDSIKGFAIFAFVAFILFIIVLIANIYLYILLRNGGTINSWASIAAIVLNILLLLVGLALFLGAIYYMVHQYRSQQSH